MTYKSFNVTLADHIAHVQLARPDAMNSMNADFWLELPLCMRELEASGEARVIVISSTGKHFSAGMDLGVFTNPKAVPMGGDPGRMAENLRRVVMQLQASLSSLEEVRLPVLVAIQGGCIGGALDMVCAADSRYCSADAYFTIKETELGMTADVGTLQRLPKLLPQGVVRELAFTGRNFSAEEAEALGFVNQVFASHEELLAGVMAIAAQIAKHSPLAVSGCKEMLNFSRDHSVADSLKYMATWQSGMFRPNDMMKTFQAKATKTQAQFDGLFNVHLKGPFFLTQTLLPLLEEHASIVNLTSATTRVATAGVAPYAAFKGGLDVLTRYMAKEFGERRIRANAVSPGAIRTELGGGLNDEFEALLAGQTALGRVGEPEDVARVIAMLLSEEGRWINAQTIEVAGGYII